MKTKGKSHVAWNKGLKLGSNPKHSEFMKEWYKTHEHPKGMLGKKHPNPQFKKGCPAPKTAFKKGDPRLIGENNPAKRPGVGKKISEAKMSHIVTKKTRRKISKAHKGKKKIPCSELKKSKLREKNKIGNYGFKEGHKAWNIGLNYRIDGRIPHGERCGNYNGAITPLNKLLRNGSKWKIWREIVFLRDNFTCQNPNCSYCHNKIGVMLHPHHIKPLALYPELVFDVNNGITYCAEFHLKGGLHKRIQKDLNKKIVYE